MGPLHHWRQNSASPAPTLWSSNHLLALHFPDSRSCSSTFCLHEHGTSRSHLSGSWGSCLQCLSPVSPSVTVLLHVME